jgi:hypothetical protein
VIVNPIRSNLVEETKEGNKCVLRQVPFVFPCAFDKLFFVQYSVALLIECTEQIACIVLRTTSLEWLLQQCCQALGLPRPDVPLQW